MNALGVRTSHLHPLQFFASSRLRERQGAQEHFLDLCRLLGEPTPGEDDPLGERYCFERGAEKVGGGDGWADVWRKHCFGWEYKGKHHDGAKTGGFWVGRAQITNRRPKRLHA